MSFKTRDHEVTCLCALVDLPKRVIVEELPPRGGLARFQLQAVVGGPIGALLEWLPVPAKRWQAGGFAFARVEVPPGEDAGLLRQVLRAVATWQREDFQVAVWLAEDEEPIATRLGRLVGALTA